MPCTLRWPIESMSVPGNVSPAAWPVRVTWSVLPAIESSDWGPVGDCASPVPMRSEPSAWGTTRQPECRPPASSGRPVTTGRGSVSPDQSGAAVHAVTRLSASAPAWE